MMITIRKIILLCNRLAGVVHIIVILVDRW